MCADSMSLSSPPGTTSPRDFDRPGEPPLPAHIQKLPDLLRHLLSGRTPVVKASKKSRKIALYVCAADSQGDVNIPAFTINIRRYIVNFRTVHFMLQNV